eukprot:s338_g4.t1
MCFDVDIDFSCTAVIAMEVRFAASGALAAELAREEFEFKTAKDVKRTLAGKLGVSRHVQRLLLEHQLVPDDEIFDAQTTSLQLALLPFQASDPECVEKLCDAARRNGIVALEQLLDLPLDPDATDPSGFFPLVGTAPRHSRFAEAMRVLLEAHATVNKIDQNMDSPLMSIAARGDGNAPVVDLLLEARACTEHRSRRDMTPLLIASVNRHFEVISSRLRGRACLTAKDDRGSTAMHLAVGRIPTKIVPKGIRASDGCFACVAFLAVHHHLPACLLPCLPWYGHMLPSGTSSRLSYLAFTMTAEARSAAAAADGRSDKVLLAGTSLGSSYFAFSMSATARIGTTDGIDCRDLFHGLA